jgi:hypothetical protein
MPEVDVVSFEGVTGTAVVDGGVEVEVVLGAVDGFPNKLPPPNKLLPGVDDDVGVVALLAGFCAPNNPVAGVAGPGI